MMGKTPTQAKHVPSTSSTSATHSQAERMQLLVCIEDDQRSAGAISHVQTIAQALGGDVVLLHFLEAAEKGGAPLDPVDWEIRRRVANDVLTNLAQKYQTADHAIQVAVLEGRRIDQLCGYAARHPGGITAFGRIEGAEGLHAWRAARCLVDADIGSILMVPSAAFTTAPTRYACVFVALDGSSVSESVIPSAAAIAKQQNAKLVVCHVVPDPGSINIGLQDRELQDLQMRLVKRAKTAARTYLDRINDMLKGYGTPATTTMIVEGDARKSLLKTIRERGGDLLIMASHGQGMDPTLPSGHVASFILDHADIPVLMMRPQRNSGDAHVSAEPVHKGTRQPADTET